jgi:hypothetical protein
MSFERRSIRLINPQQGHSAIAALWSLCKPWVIAGHSLSIEVRPEARSVAQNRIMWACLADISRQVDWHRQKLTPEDWKCMVTAALEKQRVVPGIEGGFVVLGKPTSRMTVREMSDVIEFCHAFGAEKGVRFGRTSLGRDCPDECFEEAA